MHIIQKYEHEKLFIGEQGFTQAHWKALLKLNEKFDNRYFDVLHNGIKMKQYVGVIQIDNLLIEIHPKADRNSGNEKWKNLLLPMLKSTGQLKAETAGEAHVSRQHLNLLEVYFELFLRRLETLIHRGLIKQYRKNTANTKALKGKLEFAGNIRQNLVHRERFYTRHQVYDTDHLLHRVLRLATEIVQSFTQGTRLADYSNRILWAFPEVSKVTVTGQLLQKIVLNRKSGHYAGALELARLIILNYSPDIKGGQQKMLSLLFDMNELWETYVLRILQKTVNEHPGYAHFEVSGQVKKSFIAGRSLVPDVVIRNKKTGETFVLDTKWKTPQDDTASIADLRQMYVYGRYWQAKKLILLYPSVETKNPEFEKFHVQDYSLTLENGQEQIREIRHRCKTAFIPVMNQAGSLNEKLGEEILDLFQ